MLRIDRLSPLMIALTSLAIPALGAPKTELLWEQRFDVPSLPADAWELKGTARLADGALHTLSDPAKDHSTAAMKRPEALPGGNDGYLLRVEWALVPVRIGGWGQDAHIQGGPFVVEFTGRRPTLNAKHPARDTVQEGQTVTLSCDFNRHTVFSWQINGKEQLDAPVAAWHGGLVEGRVGLADWKDSKSESRWLWVRLSKVIPEDLLPLKVGAWKDSFEVEPNQPSPFLIGVASPMEKVFREAADYHGKFGRQVHIAAAGRERESFQLVCLPLAKALHNVRITVGDLLHTNCKTRLPSHRIAWHPVGYVQTKPSNSAIRRVGWWWPDVLMPPQPFDVEPGFVQPVWFTVDVPDGTPAGTYRGFINVQADGLPAQTVGLELTVRPFSLPLRGRLKTAFCLSPGIWEAWYKPEEVRQRLGLKEGYTHGPLYSSYECQDVLPKAKWLEMYDFLLAHRLSPTVIYSHLKNGRSRTVPSREDMEYCYQRGMNATCLANVDVLPANPAAADRFMAQLEAWLADWEKFVKAKNWPDVTWYVHGFDESEMRPDPAKTVDPSIRRVYGTIKQKFPWLKRETANPYHAKHVGMFDIWTPLTQQITPESLPKYRERQAAGDEVWAYVCCGPGRPYANLFIDFPGVDPRILGWQFYQYRLTGFLYYLIDLYEYQENWNRVADKWPKRPWNTLSFKTNSDGILLYPGPDATPLASTRLENLRDGIEDYEVLAMLADLTGSLEKRGDHEDVVSKARDALRVRPTVSKSWNEYTQDPIRILDARAEVDALVESIRGILGAK